MMMKNEYCLYQRVSLFHPDAGNFCPHDFFEKRERKDVRDAPSVPGVAPLLINGTRTGHVPRQRRGQYRYVHVVPAWLLFLCLSKSTFTI
jgi:hypothetical protein